MGLQVLALACLVGAIILGFVRKMNVGIVCFGLALILGTIGGMASGKIYGGFPYKLFSTLLGTMLFFSLLQQTVRSCGRKAVLRPPLRDATSHRHRRWEKLGH